MSHHVNSALTSFLQSSCCRPSETVERAVWTGSLSQTLRQPQVLRRRKQEMRLVTSVFSAQLGLLDSVGFCELWRMLSVRGLLVHTAGRRPGPFKACKTASVQLLNSTEMCVSCRINVLGIPYSEWLLSLTAGCLRRLSLSFPVSVCLSALPKSALCS